MNRLAPAPDQRCEIADSRRQQRLDALAHAARHHRRCTAGADRHHDLAAIDDRRNDETRMRGIVHHIDGQTRRPRSRRHRNADFAGTCAEHRNDFVQPDRCGVVYTLDPRCGGRIETGDREVAVGCMPAHLRLRGKQQAQPGPDRIARSDQKDRTGARIEKDRKEFHSVLLLPNSGVD